MIYLQILLITLQNARIGRETNVYFNFMDEKIKDKIYTKILALAKI